MICAKNCEKLSKFVEVTAKILSVFFSGTRCILVIFSQVFSFYSVYCFLIFFIVSCYHYSEY